MQVPPEFQRAAVIGERADVDAAAIRVTAPVPPHTHDFVELAFVTGGDGRHITVEGESPITRGDVLVIRPGTWHAFGPEPSLDVANLYVAPESLHAQLDWVLDHPALAVALLRAGSSRARLTEPALTRVGGWLDDLMAARLAPAKAGLASAVLSEVAGASFDDEGIAGFTPLVRDAMKLLVRELDRPWLIEQLGARLNASPSHVHRSFRSQVGDSPINWLNRMRGERAATLLARSTRSVAEVGRIVGWHDPSYASRRFRAAYGVTPTEYRERFRTAGGGA